VTDAQTTPSQSDQGQIIQLTPEQFSQLLQQANSGQQPGQVYQSPFSMDPSKSVWLENKDEFACRFKAADGMTFKLERYGYVGSVVSVPKEIGENSYITRAIARGKLAQLTPDEAMERIDELVAIEDAGHEHDHLIEQMSEGASEKTSRYKKDLPTEAEPRAPITAQQVWQNQQQAPVATERPRVQRSGSEQPVPTRAEVLDPSSVLQPRVREGEMATETRTSR